LAGITHLPGNSIVIGEIIHSFHEFTEATVRDLWWLLSWWLLSSG